MIIDAQDGLVVLVGHSYGGAVITQAGTGQNVAALVYLAAFAPDNEVTTEDQMIPPPAQRIMSGRAGSTVTEVAASHSVYVSKPTAVAALIKQAASAVAARQ
jgi:pimeloyl-ACP methyl ester carboxylesterase